MKRLALVIFVFLSINSFGQFSDSLMAKEFYGDVYGFNFFKKNGVKKLKRYNVDYDEKGRAQQYKEYELYFESTKNLLVKRYHKKHIEYFKRISLANWWSVMEIVF